MSTTNSPPRYLPHMEGPTVLRMGLRPLNLRRWIEPDNDWLHYYHNKLEQRAALGDGVYRSDPDSCAAQIELADLLRAHLLNGHSSLYTDSGGLRHTPTGIELPDSSEEPLWNCSLWIADDLLLLQERKGRYRLTAASLASPSDWLLEEKFGEELADIHASIPGFDKVLGMRLNRFIKHLKYDHPIERFNWSLQMGCQLCRRKNDTLYAVPDEKVHYRCERQTLRRLPNTQAIAFTIRVYLYPLESLQSIPNAIPSLLQAIDNMAGPLASYKGFDRIASALLPFRQ